MKWVGGTEKGDIQGTDAEHERHANLLLPVELQGLELGERDGQHPDVKRDANRGVGPRDGVDAQAFALVLAVPVRPKEADRVALEDGQEEKHHAEQDAEDDGSPKQATHALAREDAQVEEQQAQLDQHDLGEVENRHEIEIKEEVGYFLRRERPDVASYAVGRCAVVRDDHARNGDDDEDKDDIVVRGHATRGDQLEADPQQDYAAGYDGQDDGSGVVGDASVAHWHAACCVGDVFGHCETSRQASQPPDVLPRKPGTSWLAHTEGLLDGAAFRDTQCNVGLERLVGADTC